MAIGNLHKICIIFHVFSRVQITDIFQTFSWHTSDIHLRSSSYHPDIFLSSSWHPTPRQSMCGAGAFNLPGEWCEAQDGWLTLPDNSDILQSASQCSLASSWLLPGNIGVLRHKDSMTPGLDVMENISELKIPPVSILNLSPIHPHSISCHNQPVEHNSIVW